jgi:hypothetical protein
LLTNVEINTTKQTPAVFQIKEKNFVEFMLVSFLRFSFKNTPDH